MTLKKNHLIAVLGSLALLVTSCNEEKFLSEATFSTQTVLAPSSNKDIDDFVRGGYFNLKSPGDWGILDLTKVHNTLVTHVVEQQPFADGSRSGTANVQPIYLRQNTENAITAIGYGFRGAYNVLQSANNVLEYYQQKGGTIVDINEAWVPRIKGEAYFLRAFAHFYLARVFAPPYSSKPNAKGIILKKSPSVSATGYDAPSTNQETYDLIISDLQQAIQLLPEKYIPGEHPETYQDRAQKDAARALLAEVYFIMGKQFWPKALEQCNAILGVNNSKYPLVKTDLRKNVFNLQGLGLRASETIWHVTFYYRNAWRTPRMSGLYTSNATNRQRGIALSSSMTDALGWNVPAEAAKDLRYRDWFIRYNAGEDPLYKTDYKESYHIWNIKYQNAVANVPMFRSPEFLLMRALIKFDAGDAAGALADLNVTRQRAGLPLLSTVTLKAIDDEWYKELSFEGTELMYLQAQKRPIPPGDRQGSDIPYDDPSLVWLFPVAELSRNPNVN